jgi:hypothetical protein
MRVLRFYSFQVESLLSREAWRMNAELILVNKSLFVRGGSARRPQTKYRMLKCQKCERKTLCSQQIMVELRWKAVDVREMSASTALQSPPVRRREKLGRANNLDALI